MATFCFGDPTPPPKAWIMGLAKNSSAPDGVLLRLLVIGALDFTLKRDWSDEVSEAVVNPPDWEVRRSFAAFGGGHRLRLARDPEPKVRAALAGSWEYGRSLPEDVL